MRTISPRLPEELVTAIDEAARAKHVSRSEGFREALTKVLEGDSGKKRGRSLFVTAAVIFAALGIVGWVTFPTIRSKLRASVGDRERDFGCGAGGCVSQ